MLAASIDGPKKKPADSTPHTGSNQGADNVWPPDLTPYKGSYQGLRASTGQKKCPPIRSPIGVGSGGIWVMRYIAMSKMKKKPQNKWESYVLNKESLLRARVRFFQSAAHSFKLDMNWMHRSWKIEQGLSIEISCSAHNANTSKHWAKFKNEKSSFFVH
jgi:hypothetical protein